jgi:hypothetical protein
MSPLRLPMYPSPVCLLSLALLAGLVDAAGAAVPGRAHGQAFTLGAEVVSEAVAAAAAQAATGGKVVGVRRVGPIYEVTVLLTSGQVQLVRVEVATGRVVAG